MLVVLSVNVANVVRMGRVNGKKVSSHRPDEPQHEMEQTVVWYCNCFTLAIISVSALYVIIVVIRQSFDIASIFQGVARNNVGVVISRVNIIRSLQVMEGTLTITIILAVV